MLSLAPGKVCARPRAVCVVAPPGGLSPLLRNHVADLRDEGCRVEQWSSAEASSPLAALANVLDVPSADASDRVRWALEKHCRECGIDEIIFPTRNGPGFRAIQAKRAGVAFENVTLTVLLDQTSAGLRREERRLAEVADLERDYAERYAFENADHRLCPDATLLDRVRRQGWRTEGAGEPTSPGESRPLVTVCMAHYNHGRYLPEALAALAAQTYDRLEVLILDDGSTDAGSRAVFTQMEQQYPQFRFLRQDNSGIGATRNRGLREASGELFIPVDADNIARPEMIERLVGGLSARPEVAALSCYFLAFAHTEDIAAGRFLYACRPTGGPHVLGCLQNVYGDANAVYRTAAFRAVGGYETDRDASFEDWEAFIKLVHAGHRTDVVPEHLFYYRHLQTGFSRTTSAAANHQRVLRQFARLEWLPVEDRESLWALLAGLHAQTRALEAKQRARRYRIADWLADRLAWGRRLLRTGGRDSGTKGEG